MNKKIYFSLVIIAVLVAVGLLAYNLSSKKSTMNINQNVEKAPLTDLGVTDLMVGTGAEAVAGDEITVQYVGKLSNDIIFDSSYNRNSPFAFTLGAGMVIQGWEQGIVGMKVGGKRLLSIPADMAYGAATRGSIPANSDLYFEVDLVSIQGK
ncbi:MAG: FKBP-type peptidyl-prolyl cis-trans isomerase [bacterium]|nr:FKBP-type peptidyl-prolyl cis-trans isomerase [bacterium]